jgi:hypothetical protein
VDAPDGYQTGLFAERRTYPVTMRFANATMLDDRDADLRGLSIRISDVDAAEGEELSPYTTVALITLPGQSIRDTLEACEAKTFNPWNYHRDHRPLGGINRVRRGLYTEIGEYRTTANEDRL